MAEKITGTQSGPTATEILALSTTVTSGWTGSDGTTHGGIRYRLQGGYPKISTSEEGASATEVYLIRSQDAAAFAAESIPPPYMLFDVGIRPLNRSLPGSDGVFITKSLDFEPFMGDDKPWDPFGRFKTDDDAYDDCCRVTINYETRLQDDDPNPTDPETFLERSITAGMEYLSIPPARSAIEDEDVYGSPGTPGAGAGAAEANRDMELPLFKHIPTVDFSLKWKFVPNPLWSLILGNLGRVNSDTPAILFSAAPTTALYTGVSAQQVFQWSGAGLKIQPWSIDFKFSQRIAKDGGRTFGWNHIFSPNKGRWVKASLADGSPIHESFAVQNFFRSR